MTSVILLLHLNPVQFLQLFDPRLHLNRLGCLVPETVNELLSILDQFLLILIGGMLDRDPLLFQGHILGIRNPVIIDFPQGKLDGPVGHIVKENPVVGDDQNSPRVGAQKTLQPLDRFNIEVIGGLIQQDVVGPCASNILASSTRMRQPPLNSCTGRSISFCSKPSPISVCSTSAWMLCPPSSSNCSLAFESSWINSR